jgi:hypothetical protein
LTWLLQRSCLNYRRHTHITVWVLQRLTSLEDSKKVGKSSRVTTRFQPGERRVGRKPGVPNKATATIKTAAQAHGPAALDKLVALMNGGNDDIAFKAAIAILDRGYGKPAQTIAGDPEKPVEHNVAVVDAFTRRMSEMAEKMKEQA